MLAIRSISAGYGSGDVIHDISLTVNDGESLSIIGPNGCGKTTLLKTIANILPFKGDIEIGGKPVSSMSHREISLKIALLSQSSGLYYTYTVYETVMMGRYLHIKDRLLGLPSAEDKKCVLDCLEAVGLSGEKDREITRLSGGQLQRVFLARALAQQPDIILLDEPTNHLDLKYQIELIEYLREWSEQGTRSVIGVLHDINLAMRLSNNLMVMKDGTARAIGKTRDIITDELLREVYEIDVADYMRKTLKMWDNLKNQ